MHQKFHLMFKLWELGALAFPDMSPTALSFFSFPSSPNSSPISLSSSQIPPTWSPAPNNLPKRQLLSIPETYKKPMESQPNSYARQSRWPATQPTHPSALSSVTCLPCSITSIPPGPHTKPHPLLPSPQLRKLLTTRPHSFLAILAYFSFNALMAHT